MNLESLSTTMKITDFLQWSSARLEELGVESARLQSELLLEHVLKEPRLELLLNQNRDLTDNEQKHLFGLVERRSQREPLQHIIGATCFCGLEIRVSSSVLIPRPETELLAEFAWKHLSREYSSRNSPLTLLDFGTGSGCVSIAVAVNCRKVHAWAIDVSQEAIEVARANAECNGVGGRIQFIQSNGFSSLPNGLQFDLIVSNPPYVPHGEIQGLEPEVRDHDPHVALDGGFDGLDFFRLIAGEAGAFLRSGGGVMAEFGDGQNAAIREIFEQHQWKIDCIEEDLNGTPRFLIALPSKSLKDLR
ncbi:MAG: peptide chain release factor N(5)-glutamine methyltransferase [Verrucomicrobia bacterium]|nr:peptide chain release factor N(5)-glutamine methyltransferase [Verrucomicrobiota bacterium]